MQNARITEKVEWLWPGRLARGLVTVLDGDPGQGKSAVSLNLAARVTAGARRKFQKFLGIFRGLRRLGPPTRPKIGRPSGIFSRRLHPRRPTGPRAGEGSGVVASEIRIRKARLVMPVRSEEALYGAANANEWHSWGLVSGSGRRSCWRAIKMRR
jgi:hypothetical protein